MADLVPIAILVVCGVAILLYGPKKAVEWARSLGKAKRAFAEEAAAKP